MNYSYNEKQFLAIESKKPNIVIIAPAGSGKTSTLVGAIRKYKEENPLARVVAITFTKKAAEELKTRLRGYAGINSSTIHSWSYQQLEDIGLRKEGVKNAFTRKIMPDEKIKEILDEICRRRRYNYIKKNELFFYIMGNYNIDIEDRVKRMYESIKTEYIEFKENNGLYDFTDLPKLLLDKLDDFEMDIDNIEALFVDEFQDVDNIQLEIFNRVNAKKKFYIGDAQQSIYLFRGATPEVLEKLKDFDKMSLEINYRSYQEIVDFATSFRVLSEESGIPFSNLMESFPSPIKCEKGYGGKVYSMNKTGSAYEINAYKKFKGETIIKEMIQDNAMILCRKNKEVKLITELGYPYVSTAHQSKGLEYKNVILTDFDTASEEDKNIAYVGMTRAEEKLLVAEFSTFYKMLQHILRERPQVEDLF